MLQMIRRISRLFMLGMMLVAPAAMAQVDIVIIGGGYDSTIEDFIRANTSVPVQFQYYGNHDGATSERLNAADLIIIGRSPASYAWTSDETRQKFDQVSTPIISFSPFVTRPDRLNWATNDINYGQPLGAATIVNPSSPLVQGLGDGTTLQVFEDGPYDPPMYNSTPAPLNNHLVSFSQSDFSTTNGDVILRRAGGNDAVLVVWEPGVEFYQGAGRTAPGPRALFCLIDDGNRLSDGQTVYPTQLDSLAPDGVEVFRRLLNTFVNGLPVEVDSFIVE